MLIQVCTPLPHILQPANSTPNLRNLLLQIRHPSKLLREAFLDDHLEDGAERRITHVLGIGEVGFVAGAPALLGGLESVLFGIGVLFENGATGLIGILPEAHVEAVFQTSHFFYLGGTIVGLLLGSFLFLELLAGGVDQVVGKNRLLRTVEATTHSLLAAGSG